MGYLENLGIGGLAGLGGWGGYVTATTASNLATSQTYYNALQQSHFLCTCIHEDCPICKERIEKQAKEQRKIATEQLHKKELYNERCKEYMVRFREKMAKRRLNESH